MILRVFWPILAKIWPKSGHSGPPGGLAGGPKNTRKRGIWHPGPGGWPGLCPGRRPRHSPKLPLLEVDPVLTGAGTAPVSHVHGHGGTVPVHCTKHTHPVVHGSCTCTGIHHPCHGWPQGQPWLASPAMAYRTPPKRAKFHYKTP